MAAFKNNQRQFYIDGNAVRSIPHRYPVEEDTHLKRLKERRRLRAINRKNIFYLVAVLSLTAVLFVFCVQYLHLRGTVATKASYISQLQDELTKLKIQNNEKEDDINTNINYNNIYNKAKNEYGMVYPKGKQIRKYNIEDSGYIKQYQNVP